MGAVFSLHIPNHKPHFVGGSEIAHIHLGNIVASGAAQIRIRPCTEVAGKSRLGRGRALRVKPIAIRLAESPVQCSIHQIGVAGRVDLRLVGDRWPGA